MCMVTTIIYYFAAIIYMVATIIYHIAAIVYHMAKTLYLNEKTRSVVFMICFMDAPIIHVLVIFS